MHLALRAAVVHELCRLELEGIIKPVQHAQWATPLVLVRQKEGGLSLYGDYRGTVNATTETLCYPLPTATEVFATLRGGTVLSILDLYQAYQQLPVNENIAEVLTVNTLKGLYSARRLPFSITFAPEVFQLIMKTIRVGIPGIGVYLNNVIVSGAS